MTYVKLEDAVKATEALLAKMAKNRYDRADESLGREVECISEQVTQALRSLPTDDGWQPIATAPRDGNTFLTYSPPALKDPDPDYDTAGFIVEKGEFWKAGCGFDWVTHWRPLPAPPSD